jgi:tetratricopeptide (TPR) repeat protein
MVLNLLNQKRLNEMNRAIQLRDAGEPQQAAAIIRALREESTNPNDIARLAIMEAGCLREKGDYQMAAELLSKARSVDIEDASVALGIQHETAGLERTDGLKKQALEHTSRILHAFGELLENPDYRPIATELRAERAMLTAESGFYEKSLPLLIQCHDAEPQRSDLLYYLGDASFRTSRFEEALKYLSQALQASDLDHRLKSPAQYLLAYSYYRLGKYAQAINVLQKLVSEGEGLDELLTLRSVYSMLADSFQKLGMDQESNRYKQCEKSCSECDSNLPH